MTNANAAKATDAERRLMSIGFGGPPRSSLQAYLGWTKTESITDWVLRQSGSIAPEIERVQIPGETKMLEASMGWPARWIIDR